MCKTSPNDAANHQSLRDNLETTICQADAARPMRSQPNPVHGKKNNTLSDRTGTGQQMEAEKPPSDVASMAYYFKSMGYPMATAIAVCSSLGVGCVRFQRQCFSITPVRHAPAFADLK